MDITLIIKAHLIIGLLSLIIYLIRGVLMLTGSAASNAKPWLISATLMMLLLLGSGGALTFLTEKALTDPFIIHKIAGLITYIIIGIIAFKIGVNNRFIGIILWLAGLAAFVYTYAIAKHITPLLF